MGQVAGSQYRNNGPGHFDGIRIRGPWRDGNVVDIVDELVIGIWGASMLGSISFSSSKMYLSANAHCRQVGLPFARCGKRSENKSSDKKPTSPLVRSSSTSLAVMAGLS